jgi:hypothetical protein
VPDKPGDHIERFIRGDRRFEHRQDPLGNDRWWHPMMPLAAVAREDWDAWLNTAEALKLRHRLNDAGDTGADG